MGSKSRLPAEYPRPILIGDTTDLRELTDLKKALEKGLDVNGLLREDQLMPPRPKGGCVQPVGVYDEDTWPHFNTPLQRAIVFGDLESAEYLLQHGARVDLYNSIGKTALHEAVYGLRHENITFLLAHGADVDKPTIEAHARYEDHNNRNIYGEGGDLPLWITLRSADSEGLRLLVEGGVNLHPDSQGPWSALDLAVLAGNLNTVEILLPERSELLDALPSSDSLLDLKDEASDLLAVMKSATLVPSHKLYGAYCKAVSHAQATQSLVSLETNPIKKSIARLLNALQSIAGDRIDEEFRRCAGCLEFESRASDSLASQRDCRVQIHADRQELEDCAQEHCDFCSLLADGFQFGQDHYSIRSSNTSPAVFLSTHLVNYRGMAPLCDLALESGNIVKAISTGCAAKSVDRNLGPKAEIDADTGSASAMRMVSTWIETCQSDISHSACQKATSIASADQSMPRRLLQMPGADGELRLVEASVIRAQYCALSYCWGHEPFFVTTQQNLSQNMAAIPQDLLPVMFRDAIRVTQDLGYRHLWIDALCVVQDNAIERHEEAMRMHTTFSNAVITISSLVADSCHTGLFQPRKLRMNRPVTLNIRKPKRSINNYGLTVALPRGIRSTPTLRGPAHSRAWVLQEQLLSKRVLYFGEGMLHWECLSKYLLESDPEGHYTSNCEHSERLAKRAMYTVQNDGEYDYAVAFPKDNAFEVWKRQLEIFTSCNITNDSDRLLAFYPISERLAHAAENTVVCGIWSGSHLLESLCWRATKPQRCDTTSSVIPTWSWAHINLPISFDLIDMSTRGHLDIRPQCAVLSLDVQENGVMSETTGSLRLKGKLRTLLPFDISILVDDRVLINAEFGIRVRRHGLKANAIKIPRAGGICETLKDDRMVVVFDYGTGSLENCFTFDLLVLPNGRKPTGYGYPRYPNGRPPAKIMLLLELVDADSYVFRRIGIASVDCAGNENGDAEGDVNRATSSCQAIRII